MTDHAIAIQREQLTTSNIHLQVEGLTKGYGENPLDNVILEDLSFEVNRGEFVCIVGPSGAGKTTLLRCLSGLLHPTEGRVLLDGKTVKEPPENMAVVFQDYTRSLLPWLSVEENIALPLRSQGVPKKERAERCRTALDSVGLSGSKDKYPWQLSGGMQQRVAIARALAFDPQILVMDEPFASVDAQTRFDLEDLVLKLKNEFGITILLVTHDIDESVYLSNRVVVVSKGPATVKAEIPISFPEPRDQITTRAHHDFATVRSQIMLMIKEESRKEETDAA